MMGLGGSFTHTGANQGLMSSGAAPETFDKLAPGGGMDVMGSIKAHGNFGAQYGMGGDPTGGMSQGGGLFGLGNFGRVTWGQGF